MSGAGRPGRSGGGAAQRLTAALAADAAGRSGAPAVGGRSGVGGAAARLSGAGAQLAASLADQVAGLTGTAEQLGSHGVGFAGVDEANAALIAALDGAGDGRPRCPVGLAPAAPPVPADVRAPLPPVPAASGRRCPRRSHTGDPCGR